MDKLFVNEILRWINCLYLNFLTKMKNETLYVAGAKAVSNDSVIGNNLLGNKNVNRM